jgi:hypothetical protein
MTTDQLEENLRREFHRLDTRMAEARNLDLPGYVASPAARPRRWVRVAAVAAVAATVVLLIPILKPSDKPTSVRFADAQAILPGETPREAEERITRACMVEGGLEPIDGGFASVDDGPLFAAAAYKDSPEATARQEVCHKRIEDLGIIAAPSPAQWAGFYPHVVALVDCLRANGFDMGTIISLDEYVSSGGKTPVSPRLDELASADTTDPKYWECEKEILLYTSILKT